MSQLSLFRGTTSEVTNRQLTDGQLLVDTQAGVVKVDYDNGGTVQRITVSGSGGAGSQSDFAETDPTASSYIQNKPTKTSDFTDTLFIYSNTEPTTDLVSGKTEWIGGDGRVNLTFINMDGTTYAEYFMHSGDTFPTIEDPTATGYTFDQWNPSLPNTVPTEDTTYVAEAVGMVTLTFYGQNNSLYKTVEAYPGDPFPTVADPTSPDGSAEFKSWSPSLPSTVPNSDTYYKSNWDRNTSIQIQAFGDASNYSGYFNAGPNTVLSGYYKPGTTFPSYTLPASMTCYPTDYSQNRLVLTQYDWGPTTSYPFGLGEPPSTVPAADGYTKTYVAVYNEQ